MSDLKWQTVEQLQASKAASEKKISQLKSQFNNEQVRLEWINKYLFLKTPQELTYEEVEQRLGHKLIIKDS